MQAMQTLRDGRGRIGPLLCEKAARTRVGRTTGYNGGLSDASRLFTSAIRFCWSNSASSSEIWLKYASKRTGRRKKEPDGRDEASLISLIYQRLVGRERRDARVSEKKK